MATKQHNNNLTGKPVKIKKKTSIGHSPFSRPSSKDQKRDYKKYRGQGKAK